MCYEFAMLREKGSMRSLTSCSGEERINTVFTSKTNELTLEIVNPNILDTLDTFLIKYQGRYYIVLWNRVTTTLCVNFKFI